MCYLIDALMRVSIAFNCTLCTVNVMYTHSTVTGSWRVYITHTTQTTGQYSSGTRARMRRGGVIGLVDF